MINLVRAGHEITAGVASSSAEDPPGERGNCRTVGGGVAYEVIAAGREASHYVKKYVGNRDSPAKIVASPRRATSTLWSCSSRPGPLTHSPRCHDS